jgi:glycosyltransferase involved in cell wall biosynthesis
VPVLYGGSCSWACWSRRRAAGLAALGRHADRPDLELSLAGAGPRAYVAELQATAADLPVRFLGRLDRDAVTDAYRRHDALVLPSIWDEPFAVVLPDDLMVGTPGALKQMVDAYHEIGGGVVVPPGDPAALRAAILRLAGEAGLAASLAANGQAWARGTLAFPLFMDRLERLYQGALRSA